MPTIYSLEADLAAAQERLSLIASAFAVVDDATADGNRAANARQTIRDVLAGHVVHVVSAGTYAAAQEKAEKLEAMLESHREARTAALLAADDAQVDLARVKAEAALVAHDVRSMVFAFDRGDSRRDVVRAMANRLMHLGEVALASPTPAQGDEVPR